MSAPARLTGGLIDRDKPLRFSFDGTAMTGFAGDTLASALVASGTRLVGRSFKYHRPRGIFSAGSEEPNALVELRSGARREPNTKATTVELYDGLEAHSQNRWPSLAFDLRAVHQFASPLIVAGFYYKTFMWPASFWEKLYEPLIRRSAGLGRLSGEPDPDTYEKATAFCDLLIIGAGPSGLAAALAAGRAGARVILVEEDFGLGGRLLSELCEIDGMPGTEWARLAETELASLGNVRILRRASVFGIYDDEFGVIERVADHLPVPPAFTPRQRLWKIVARESLLATGATERPIVFGGNDRPGVMLASAVRSYVNRFAAAPGQRAVVFTTSDDGWRSAADLLRAGVEVAAVIDPRRDVAASVRALAGNAPVHLGASVTDAIGGKSLRAVEFVDANDRRHKLGADLLAVSGGWNPNIALATHLGGKGEWNPETSAFLAAGAPKAMTIAGAAAGRFTLAQSLDDGARWGLDAASRCGHAGAAQPIYRASDEAFAVTPLWQVAGVRGKAFVDLQNDVTADDIEISAREGFRSVEHLKRYTTLGMATDQGKTSNVNGLAIMAALTERGIAAAGTTRARPPQVPVAIGAFGGLSTGKHFKPTRLTSTHDWSAQQGASFVETGQWLRAQWFAQPGETEWLQSVSREVTEVRSRVGICDVSTLGKIALCGADVGVFLDRVYINTFSTLAVGKVRYGVMLREDGFVMDDGTTARLAEDHYVMSTTTANAVKVMQHLEFCHQVLWPELDVQMVSVTEQWAQVAVAGPQSRALLQNLFGPGVDLSDTAFPYMACGEFRLGDVPARLFRISFSGERAYEIAVPAGYGDALMRALMTAGEGLGVVPYGTEALGVMRIEKGHAAGNELNGQTVARDLGLGRMMSTKKDFIGRVMAGRPALIDPARPTLVGLRPVDRNDRLRNGAHLFAPGVTPAPETDQGFVTSSAFSPSLGHWIALALLSRGPERIGERIRVFDPIRSHDFEAEIVSPVFVDPEGVRLRG
ncbi:sarcosine oxidase subunit alpha family protein [Rhodopseudomonas palustris]|uniref:sarcosine oxidase subunit alpha family protein n=1 Tax=Rhodopseudomonas palustris TaxID=1076 RepID=UPI002ACE6EBF|nr:sarcosine oxidase subunit alpha family protein [Rhodopseudomonas palustris]WQG99418.1 sarcosine oxidase subunit alpha family protein [Rhodopseudomonas palustris]